MQKGPLPEEQWIFHLCWDPSRGHDEEIGHPNRPRRFSVFPWEHECHRYPGGERGDVEKLPTVRVEWRDDGQVQYDIPGFRDILEQAEYTWDEELPLIRHAEERERRGEDMDGP
jgi:hypothetical protein